MIKGAWIKPGAAVIDVGMNRDSARRQICEGQTFGSTKRPRRANQPPSSPKVPGGVGPMTIAMLLANTIEAAKRQLGT